LENFSLYQDKQLFARIATDDSIAFRQLFDKYFHPLRLNALKLLKSEFWAEEVTQEALLQVWESRHTLSTIENPAAWLYRIVGNKCIDRMRRQQIELRAQYVINSISNDKQHARETEKYDYNRLRRLISEAVNSLPEQQKLVYTLQQEEELSYKEIAGRLGISPHTVRNHLVRAFNAIRNHLLDNADFVTLLLFFCHCYHS
jgi:RNA polymerase sigma-70 factor (ECF subfamily)